MPVINVPMDTGMPKKVNISEHTMRWLRKNHDSFTHKELASKVGCCVDTLKRILHREGLQYFEGAKYVATNETPVQKWSRACIRCKDTKPRPKWQYICSGCWGKEYEDT